MTSSDSQSNVDFFFSYTWLHSLCGGNAFGIKVKRVETMSEILYIEMWHQQLLHRWVKGRYIYIYTHIYIYIYRYISRDGVYINISLFFLWVYIFIFRHLGYIEQSVQISQCRYKDLDFDTYNLS